MIKFPTKYLILDAVDLCGKTTLYNSIHKKSKFAWNIQDRSALSMYVYSVFYKRKTKHELKQKLIEELCCLNNRFIFMTAPWDIIEERFKSRGDEHQTLASLEKLYDIYEENDWVRSLPNTMLIDNSELTTEDVADTVVGWVKTKEEFGIDEIASEVWQFVAHAEKKQEAVLDFMFYDDGEFEDEDLDILDDPVEGMYYEKIMIDFFDKITNELNGQNERSEIQDSASRRFIYTGSECLSLIHAMLHDEILDFHIVMRSTNVETTFMKDLNFIYFLAAETKRRFPFLVPGEVKFRINLNSAHII